MHNSYLEKTNLSLKHELLDQMRTFAENSHIPIISEDGIHLFLQLVSLSKAKRILEIGTAIAYTSIALGLQEGVKVTTIERNPEMIMLAKKYVSEAQLAEDITIIESDALLVDETTLGEFDCIFIDAAKSQYIKFFEKYEKCLKKDGFIITDNLLFRGQVEEPSTIISRNRKQLVGKIRKFNSWLIQNSNYLTYIYDIGDGIAISIKK